MQNQLIHYQRFPTNTLNWNLHSSKMPITQDDVPNYEPIKALVRDLHMTRNIARPETNYNTKSTDLMDQRSRSCKNSPNAQKLIIQHMNILNGGPHKAQIENCKFYIENDDDASDTNTSSMNVSVSSIPHPCNRRAKGLTFDGSFSIPSVVITEVNEPLDLITSTQRRFSQLYSGLRRFSTSHTVCMPNKMANQISNTDINIKRIIRSTHRLNWYRLINVHIHCTKVDTNNINVKCARFDAKHKLNIERESPKQITLNDTFVDAIKATTTKKFSSRRPRIFEILKN